MRKKLASACLFLVAMAAPLHAQPRYDLIPENCGQETSDSSLRLTKNSFEFYESSCLVTEHNIVSQSTSDLTLDCSGEGESWTLKLRVEVTKLGLRVTDDAGTYDYMSCN